MIKKTLFALLIVILPLTAMNSMWAAHSNDKEQTLSIIKPDAVKENHIGEIVARFEKNGLSITAMKMLQLTKAQAMQFYVEHKERPFYNDLTNFMTSGPVVVMVLEGENAIMKNRDLMGATDPSQAKPGTIRKDFAQSKQSNAVHGSDSPESAKREITFFFQPQEIISR
jgi:nucleoside-diphosphate kinase